jgi:transcriptional regulator with XRE-family HTH domain
MKEITGRDIEWIRERLGWNQARIAKELGVSITTVHRREKGSPVKKLEAEAIEKIAKENGIRL